MVPSPSSAAASATLMRGGLSSSRIVPVAAAALESSSPPSAPEMSLTSKVNVSSPSVSSSSQIVTFTVSDVSPMAMVPSASGRVR